MMKALTNSHVFRWLCTLVFAGMLSACDKGPEPVKGFILPEGDVERGKQVFVATGCLTCHTIKDEELPEPSIPRVLDIKLGGGVYRVKNYGELLTSIINPTHVVSAKYRATLDRDDRKDAKSPMPEFNDVINVTQLIDLTAFLHSRYELLQPQYRGYMYVP